MLCMLALCLSIAACSSGTDAECTQLKKAIEQGKTEDVAKLAAELYAKKSECNIESLTQLAIAYNFLAEKEMAGANDPANLTDYIEKAIDCYSTAETLDAEATKEAFNEAGKTDFKNALGQLKEQLRQAQEAEQALLDQINS